MTMTGTGADTVTCPAWPGACGSRTGGASAAGRLTRRCAALGRGSGSGSGSDRMPFSVQISSISSASQIQNFSVSGRCGIVTGQIINAEPGPRRKRQPIVVLALVIVFSAKLIGSTKWQDDRYLQHADGCM